MAATGRPRCTPSRTSRAAVPTAATAGAAARSCSRSRGALHDLSWLADHPHQKAHAGRAGTLRRPARGPGERPGDPGARRDRRVRRGGAAGRPRGRGRARGGRARGARAGAGTPRLASSRNRVPRVGRAGRGGRGTPTPRGAPHRGRRGPRGAAERRQVHLALAADGGASEDRELPVHDAHARTWGWPAGSGDRFVVADVPGLDRGGEPRARGSVIGSCATSCGAARSCWSWI